MRALIAANSCAQLHSSPSAPTQQLPTLTNAATKIMRSLRRPSEQFTSRQALPIARHQPAARGLVMHASTAPVQLSSLTRLQVL